MLTLSLQSATAYPRPGARNCLRLALLSRSRTARHRFLSVREDPPREQPGFRNQSSLLTEDEGRNWSNEPDVCISRRSM